MKHPIRMLRIPRSVLYNAAIIIWTTILLMFRPSIIGQRYNKLVFVVFFVLTVVIALLRREQMMQIPKANLHVFGLVICCLGYLFCQGLVLSSSPNVVMTSVTIQLGIISCLIFVMRQENRMVIAKTFVYIHVILSCSVIMTWIIVFVLKVDYLRITLTEFNVDGYGGVHQILFPITIVWSDMSLFVIHFKRFVGIYREPGMAQIFFCTALLMTYVFEFKCNAFLRMTLLLGSILTFSTSFFASISLGYVIFAIINAFRGKWFATIPGLAIATALIFFFFADSSITNMGIQGKMNSASMNDRLLSAESKMASYLSNPLFGEGYLSGFKHDANGVAGAAESDSQPIGIIGMLGQIGAVGVLLYLITWTFCFFKFGSIKSLPVYVPCVLTMLTSQMTYTEVINWFVFMLCYREIGDKGISLFKFAKRKYNNGPQLYSISQCLAKSKSNSTAS